MFVVDRVVRVYWKLLLYSRMKFPPGNNEMKKGQRYFLISAPMNRKHLINQFKFLSRGIQYCE